MDDSKANVPANRQAKFGQAVVIFLSTTLNLARDRARAHIGILHSGLFCLLSSLL
tara:strand:+ start:247 stop:411 length:165 start_codon:yes stop_codon:yes gene_type:complete